ncbi:GFA family protein [Glaciecola sp. 1036]|uniref:GFA family protein n=1 Tax=Alteromonadaceae TaxID=72275 RepID=UPI003D06F82F
MKYQGSCHCESVKFEVELPDSVECERCNCSICKMFGLVQIIIPLRDFTLLSGDDSLSNYKFNTGVAQHTFCKHCGVKAFYTPRSNPDGISINVNALKRLPKYVSIVDFDGQNWEQNAAKLAYKSR